MRDNINKSVRVKGNITGANVVTGDNVSGLSINFGQEDRTEIQTQLARLRGAIESATLADGIKKVLLKNVIPEMERAVESNEPKAGLEGGLKQINNQLEGVDAAATHVSSILTAVQTIAGKAGIALATAAPFLARLIGFQ